MVTTQNVREPPAKSQKARISKRTIDGLLDSPPGCIVRDIDITGFAARKNANGSVSFYIERRETPGRKSQVRRLTIGKFGPLTSDEARRIAKELIGKAAAGHRPFSERSAQRNDKTVSELLNRCLKEHWRLQCKASTLKELERLVANVLKPGLGHLRLNELCPADIERWRIGNVHRPRSANQALALLSKALSFGMKRGLVDRNAATLSDRFKETKRRRIPSREEIRRLWTALAHEDVPEQVSFAVKLLVLTGARVSEWLQARWSDVDTAERVLRRDDTKVGGREFPLAEPVVQLLKEAAGRRQGVWIVPDVTSMDRPLSYGIFYLHWRNILHAAGVTDLRPHDLRRHFATVAARAGMSAFAIQESLGHRSVVMASRYVADSRGAARELGEELASRLLVTVNGGPDV